MKQGGRRGGMPLNFFQGREGGFAGFLEIGQGKGQGIGGIGFGQVLQGEHSLDHFGDRQFLGSSVSDNGLFDTSGSHFKDIQSKFGSDQESGAAGFTHHDSRFEVMNVEEAFDDADGGLMFFDGTAEGGPNLEEAA